MNYKVTGFKQIKVPAVVWHRLKIMSVKNHMSLQDLTERLLVQALKYGTTLTTTKDNEK
jgi:hypothetical protein